MGAQKILRTDARKYVPPTPKKCFCKLLAMFIGVLNVKITAWKSTVKRLYCYKIKVRSGLKSLSQIKLAFKGIEFFVTNSNFIVTKIPTTKWCIPFIFQTCIGWSTRIHSLKYLRSAIFGFKEIGISKSEFVAKTQLLSLPKF